MAPFREMCFTPAEFAKMAKVDRALIPALESSGLLKTVKRKIGNVERKMITLEDMQEYFRTLGSRGDQIEAAVQALAAAAAEVNTMTVVDTAATTTAPVENAETPEAPAEMGSIEAGATAGETAIQAHTAATTPTITQGEGAEAAGPAVPAVDAETIALATGFVPLAPRHKVQMFYNVKGGTGKSTLTAQYVMRAAMMGYNVLAIDLDGQGHLTVNLDVLDGHERPTIYDVLINDLHIQNAIMNVAPCLDLIPANLGLCNIEIPLNHKPRREYRLSEAIAKIADQYDLIVADTNPAASILNGSMLVASELVNVVCATNPLSFHGMSLVMGTIEQMEQEFRRQLDVKIIPNMYDNREVISQEVLGELKAQFPENCARSVVNRSADLNEATKRRTAVWDVSSKGTAAADIDSLTEELTLG